MEKILDVFGIDWRLLVINAINFGILLLALRYFLYRPIMDMLEKRREKGAEGDKNAELAERELQETEAARVVVLSKAGKEADSLLAHGRERGIKKKKKLMPPAEQAQEPPLKKAE